MSVEQYKTQVLLLHSQQSTLDVLTTAFNDDYSVHCATSGTDALNTLGDTPIHVILSAQDLPGMSGLDALREAQKRSPDTVGILLAGPDKSDGLDALVRNKGNFRIFRGAVTAKSALELVQAAMNKSGEPVFEEPASNSIDAFDDFDDMESEHIVIETSESGATIISDGTGKMKILEPEKFSANAELAGRAIDVLVLTRDQEFLATVRDASRALHKVHHAETEQQAEDIARTTPIAVLITDAGIVGDSIETLTQKLRDGRSRLVAIVAGRREDGEKLMDLINRGHVYRFLLKPVSPGRARLAIEASIKHYQDAPDSAFKTKSGQAESAPPAPDKKKPAAAKPESKAGKTRAKKPAKAGSTARADSQKTSQTAQRITPTFAKAPLAEDIDNVFEVESSFVETMTDIAVSIGQKLTADRGRTDPPAAPATPLAAAAINKAETGSSETMLPPAARLPRTLGMAGGAIALTAVVAWMLTGGEPADVTNPIAAATPVQTSPLAGPNAALQAPVESNPASESPAAGHALTVYQILLDAARTARDAGNLISPAGNNAVALYGVALAEAPGDPTIKAELDSVVAQVLALAETAILEQKAAAANEALAAVRLADPNNPRIALLDAQVAQLGLRAKLDEARLAIGELRFDEAEALIAVAGSMQGGESVDVNLVSLELATARNQARVAEIIAIADERAAAGLLLSPPNDSARFHYELALIKDPGNQSALQGLTTVASKLVDHAVQAIELARFDEADSLLRDAAAINPSSTELSAGYAALAAAREAVAEAERQAEAARVAELERQAEAERQAELKRQQEIQQQAELERQAVAAREAERLAELELLAERERQAALEKQAQLDRLAELERQAEVERQAALKRQAELEKQAELQRLADLERQAEQERLAEIAQHEEDARVLERQEAERQAVEQNAAAAAASSVVGVAAAKAQPAPKAAPQKAAAVVTPPAQNRGSATAPEPASLAAARQTEIEDNQALLADSGAANVVVTDVAPAFGLGTGARQAQVPAGLPQFAGSSIGSFATNGADAAAHQVVPISSLTRTNYVPPVYPRAAQRKNLHGAVEVEFTVDRNGAVTDLLVIDSNPGDTFSQAALDAVQQWRFEPVVVDGRAVEKRTAVKLHFDLE